MQRVMLKAKIHRATLTATELHYEGSVAVDRLLLEQADILPGEQHAGGSLTITIEEPEPAALFLRFSYTTSFASNPNSEERAYIDYIKSAYHQSDVDCVQIIRTLAAGGLPQ